MTPDLRECLLRELESIQRALTAPSLAETLRLLESPCFERVTDAHVREVAEYRPIEVAGERFFERAWSRSKEAAAALGFALLLGVEPVHEDLTALAASINPAPR